jgi:DNA-binding NarL/FixJ family response regulator
MKREATRKVIEAIYRILEGKIYVSDTLSEVLASRYTEGIAAAASAIHDLSDREWEIFQHLGQGDGIFTIAAALHISAKTVPAHCARMRAKLHLQSTRELLREAIRRSQVSSTR